MNYKELLMKAQAKLDEKRKELEDLETEKKDIMIKFQNANLETQKQIEKEMAESELKYITLSEEVMEIAEKIKKIKKMICG